jgi:DNA end-binding protein Ku
LNTYALRAVIEEKKKGLPVRPSADVEHDETVVDLMEALKRSLGTAAPRAPGGQAQSREPQ